MRGTGIFNLSIGYSRVVLISMEDPTLKTNVALHKIFSLFSYVAFVWSDFVTDPSV